MELRNLIIRAQNKFGHLVLCHSALVALFYFMRCSQLEHNEGILYNFLSIYQIRIESGGWMVCGCKRTLDRK